MNNTLIKVTVGFPGSDDEPISLERAYNLVNGKIVLIFYNFNLS